VRDPILLTKPRLERRGTDLVGEVVHVDRFGTLVTSLPGDGVDLEGTVRIAGRGVPFRTTYRDVASGSLVAYVGSGGTVEIALRDGRADSAMGAARGAEVRATAREAGR
jgi:hypothetical protein